MPMGPENRSTGTVGGRENKDIGSAGLPSCDFGLCRHGAAYLARDRQFPF